ncbi:MAG: type II toxin-antitoxin system RelE/ParE family toxin, partial [Cucumibacter sp.]
MIAMQTVLETPQFAREAKKLFSEDERIACASMIAFNPLAGDEIVGSGGVRKVRFATGNKGKSGGSRIIYFYFDEDAPIYLIACFAKNQKADLADAEVAVMAKFTAATKAAHRKA